MDTNADTRSNPESRGRTKAEQPTVTARMERAAPDEQMKLHRVAASFEDGQQQSMSRSQLHLVHFDGGVTMGRAIFQPGWKWSRDIRPAVGGEYCQQSHLGYIIDGQMKIFLPDRTERMLSKGDAFVLSTEHDGEVIGNEPCIVLDVQGMGQYGRSNVREGAAQSRPQLFAAMSFDMPSETRQLSKARIAVLKFEDGSVVGKAVFEPGWHWRHDVGSVVGGDLCQHEHVGMILQGQLRVEMQDGDMRLLKAGDALHLLPGHDAWVEGDEQVIALDFDRSSEGYGLRQDK